MLVNRIRDFVRRHPALRETVRSVRGGLPRGIGGIEPSWRERRFDLALPIRENGTDAGPETLSFTVPGGLWAPRKLEREGLAGFEPETLACFLAALDHAGPGAVLDIGANVGVYGLLAAARGTRPVHAFEPTPRVAATARELAAANGLPIAVVECALGDRFGRASFTLSSTSDASNSLAKGFRPAAERIEVRVDTLSRWCERTGTVPAVVKIDTETTEPEVIAGGIEALRAFRPWILCEVLPGRGVEKRLMRLMRRLDYGWYRLGDEVPPPTRGVIDGRSADADQRMWLFAPETPSDAFWADTRAWGRALETCVPTSMLRA